MGLKHNAQTITDGLVLYLDAGNERSSTIWNSHPYPLDIYAFRSTGTSATLTRDNATEKSPAGGMPMKMVPTGADPVQDTRSSPIYNLLPITSGQTCTFSLYVKGESATKASLFIFDTISNGTNVVPYWSSLYEESISTNWVRLSITRTMEHSGTTYAQVRIDGPDAGDVTTWWDGAQVEYGNMMNDFSANQSKVWYDLSQNASHAYYSGLTYYSGSTYYSDGCYVFTSGHSFVDFYAPNLTASATTVEMWAKLGSVFDVILMGWNTYDIYTGTNSLGFNTANGDIYGISSTGVTNLGLVGNWKHYIFVFRGDVAYTNNKIYINGESQSLSQLGGSEDSNNRNFNNGYGKISGWILNQDYRIPMNCSIFKVYNRELTQSEVSQNFNIIKRRYGL